MRKTLPVTRRPAEIRKSICRVLTNVLAESHIDQRVNPQAFYMLLSSNFPSLMTQGGFDLVPIWQSLRAQIGDDPCMPGLFIAFQERLTKEGVASIAPTEVSDLVSGARDHAVSVAFETVAEEAIIEEMVAGALEFHTEELPVLETHELIPLADTTRSTAQVRHDIIHYVVQNLKRAPFADQVDFSQLAFRINEYFASLYDGEKFNLAPVIDSLEDVPGYTHRAIYPALVQLHGQLSEIGVGLLVPDLGITPEEGSLLVAKTESPPKATPFTPSQPPPIGPLKTAVERHKSQLRKFGLTHQSSIKWQQVRIAGMVVTLLIACLTTWLLRPNRRLAPENYVLPLHSAELKSGVFVGSLNEDSWYATKPSQREDLVQQFETLLRTDGFAANAIVIDSQGRLVLQSDATGHVQASKFALRSPDGVTFPSAIHPLNPRDIATQSGRQ